MESSQDRVLDRKLGYLIGLGVGAEIFISWPENWTRISFWVWFSLPTPEPENFSLSTPVTRPLSLTDTSSYPR
jgi:hypothetical protein